MIMRLPSAVSRLTQLARSQTSWSAISNDETAAAAHQAALKRTRLQRTCLLPWIETPCSGTILAQFVPLRGADPDRELLQTNRGRDVSETIENLDARRDGHLPDLGSDT
jgi:hypothetical protein